MADRSKTIIRRIPEWWNQFTSKQKAIVAYGAAGVVMAFAVLLIVLARPQHELPGADGGAVSSY